MLNALSIDLEDWFHAELVRPRVRTDRPERRVAWAVEPILLLLDRYDVRATFFVVGRRAAPSPGTRAAYPMRRATRSAATAGATGGSIRWLPNALPGNWKSSTGTQSASCRWTRSSATAPPPFRWMKGLPGRSTCCGCVGCAMIRASFRSRRRSTGWWVVPRYLTAR